MGSRSNSPRLASARLLPLFWMGLGALAVIASLRIDRIRHASSVPVLAEIPTRGGAPLHRTKKAGSLGMWDRILPEAAPDFYGGSDSEDEPEKNAGGMPLLREAVGPMGSASISRKTPRVARDDSTSDASHPPVPSRSGSRSTPSANRNPRGDAPNVDTVSKSAPGANQVPDAPLPSKTSPENVSRRGLSTMRRTTTRFSELGKLTSRLGERASEIIRTQLWDGRMFGNRMRAAVRPRPPYPGNRKTGPSDRKIPGRSTVRRMLKRGFLRPPSNAPPPNLQRIQTEAARPSLSGGLMKFLIPPASDVEAISPPKGAAAKDAGTPPKHHWHATTAGRLWHAGPAWASTHRDGWVWLVSAKKRWWVLARPDQPLVWHQNRWWWKKPEGWFLLHEGEPWAYRQFQNLRRDGLVHPATGMRILYDKDGRRASVEIPGQKRVLIDLGADEAER